MLPQNAVIEQETQEQRPLLQERFVEQVEDHSRPAEEVLNDQRESRSPEQARPLFVP